MRIKKWLPFCFALLAAAVSYAQAPHQFNYQAVLRNNTGGIIASQAVALKFSILSGSATGTVVYSETHSTTTTAFGQVNRVIGSGTVITGALAGVAWGSGAYYLKVEFDPTGGANYQVLGTTQLLSTPYSLFSNQVGGLTLSGQNVSLGYNTGVNSLYWHSNTFIGDRAGNALNGGYYNTFLGESSGRAITTGTANSFVGTSTGRSTTIGSNNSFYGKGAGSSNTSGAGNTFVGTSSGVFTTTADENTFLGYNSGLKNATGYRNTLLGALAGYNNVSGSGNVFIGYKAGVDELQSNKFYLANNSGSTNVLIQGDFATGSVSVRGLLETKSGGIKFPDGTIQTTASVGGGSDNQTLSVTGHTLNISNGNSVILPDNVNDADADPSNELQTLSISGDTLHISNGNSVVLPINPSDDEDTDPANELQTLSLAGSTLSISDGNSVNLSELPGDNLGNHTAQRNIKMNDFWLSRNGVGDNNGLKIDAFGNTVISKNLGIGVLYNPASKLQILASGLAGIIVDHSGDAGEGMRITKNGANSALHIEKESGNAHGLGIYYGGSSDALYIRRTSNRSEALIYLDNAVNSTKYLINTSSLANLSSTGQWNSASDSTRKFEVKSLEYGLKTVMTLKPVRYKWKIDSTNAVGFIAQEVKKMIPEVVFGENGNMTVSYDNLVAVLAKAIQEQQAQIETLEQKNALLGMKLDTLTHLATEIQTLKQKMELMNQVLQDKMNQKAPKLKTATR